jgi:hypothetical protein
MDLSETVSLFLVKVNPRKELSSDFTTRLLSLLTFTVGADLVSALSSGEHKIRPYSTNTALMLLSFAGEPSCKDLLFLKSARFHFVSLTIHVPLSPEPVGFARVVPARPRAEPYMQFLSVVSHVCTPASA